LTKRGAYRESIFEGKGIGLIAYESPLYQVLSLEPALAGEQTVPRTGQTLPMSAILRQILEAGKPPPQQQP
jgi:hypothetical protein